MRKQSFWTAASYHIVLEQVYGNEENFVSKDKFIFTQKDIVQLMRVFYHEVKVKNNDYRNAVINTCKSLGEFYAPYFRQGMKPNSIFSFVQKVFIG